MMRQDWKSTLHEYIRTRNQMGIDYKMDLMLPIVQDQAFVTMQQKKLQDIKLWHEHRGIIPERNETRFKIVQQQIKDSKVKVDIAIKLKGSYKQGRREYKEDRIEHEKITLRHISEDWIITKVEPALPENKAESNSKPRTRKKIQSTPFLNRKLLARSPIVLQRSTPYDRNKAAQYADMWWDQPNPEFIYFDVDCTNYVSQCLYAGNAPMNYTGNKEAGWWYRGGSEGQGRWSFSWSVSHSLHWYLASSRSGLRAERVKSASQLKIGDVIIYDWDGNSNYEHSTIVTAFDGAGMPLVNAHTVNSRHRYWDYRDSYAWSENTKYRFYHISDSF